jgi:hypothetical protein
MQRKYNEYLLADLVLRQEPDDEEENDEEDDSGKKDDDGDEGYSNCIQSDPRTVVAFPGSLETARN